MKHRGNLTTTQTGIPILECATCGYTHPITRKHCEDCGHAHIFPCRMTTEPSTDD